MNRYLVPVYLPKGIYTGLRRLKHALISRRKDEKPKNLDLSGDRDIEWSYIASRLPTGPGYVLDFGCGYGNMSIHAIQKGYRVLALDLEPNSFPWLHPNLEVMCGDILKLNLTRNAFDFILNCSTVEHVGLAGRYGVAAQETDGDLAAMQKLRALMKANGKMLMTIPCGRDAAITPWHRVYGKQRLPRLLAGYKIVEEIYWVKRADNRWYPCDSDAALCYIPTRHPTIATQCSYALGCFVLSSEG